MILKRNLLITGLGIITLKRGVYISQDPIRLKGNNPNIYAYVKDSYWRIAIFGLTTCEEEIRALPRLENMTRDQIFRILDEKDFYMIKNDDGDFSFAKYTYKDDKYAVVGVDKGNKDLPFFCWLC